MRLEGRRVFRPRRRVQRESSLSTFDRNSLPTRFLRSENVSNGFVRSFDDAIARDQESATQTKESEVFLTGAEVIQERTSPPVSFCLFFALFFFALFLFFLVLLEKTDDRVKQKVREKKVPPSSSLLLPPPSSFLPRW